jgi:hypothetical protein
MATGVLFMAKKSNSWMRFGVVASVVWVVGSFWFFYGKANETGVASASSIHALCVAAVPRTRDCSAELTRNVQLFTSGSWMEAAINSVVPLIVAWLLVFLVRRVSLLGRVPVAGPMER